MTTTGSPLLVTIVDDNELAVAGLGRLLETYAERVRLVPVREALARPADLDVVLHEPVGTSGFSLSMLSDLMRSSQARLVTFTWAPADQLPVPVDHFLPKSMTGSQIVRHLEDLCEGRDDLAPQPRVSATPAPAALAPVPSPRSAGATPETDDELAAAGLTPREHEILVLITRGLSNGEIAEELGLSINSIKTYIRQAYSKLDVSRRTQAVAWGIRHGLDREELAIAG